MTYNIVCIANDNYAQHACVMLTSLFETNQNKKFEIYLLTDDFSSENEKKLRSQCERYNNRLILKKMALEDYGLEKLNHSRWNKIIYFKLFLPFVLPQSIQKCLFVDVDLVINHDIEDLYQFDFGDSVLAGCEDMWDVKKHRKRLDLAEDDGYINSGVMMVHLDNWRKYGNMDDMFTFLISKLDIMVNEQDAFALYFRKRIKYLPTNQWNATTFFFHLEPHILPKYYNELNKVRFNPYIIHFCFKMRPWYKECKHPYKKLYENYLNLSPYKGNIFNYEDRLVGIKYTVRYWLAYFKLYTWSLYEIPLGQNRKQILKY